MPTEEERKTMNKNDEVARNLRKVLKSGYAPTWKDLCEAVLCRASDGLKKDCIECVKELVDLVRSHEPIMDGSDTVPIFGDFRYHSNTGKMCVVIGEGTEIYGFDVVFEGENIITAVPPEELQLEKPVFEICEEGDSDGD